MKKFGSAICIISLLLLITSCTEDQPSEPPALKEPTVKIVSPQNNSAVYGSTNIEVEVIHDKNIAKVEVYIDGISDPGKTFEYESGKYRYAWSASSLSDNSSHTIYARAEDDDGNTGRSETIEVVVYRFPAPTGLQFTHISGHEINLFWVDNNSYEDGYIIERKTGSETFSELARVNSDIVRFNDNALSTNSNYKYRVRGYKDSIFSDYTNEIEISYLQYIEMSKVLEGHSGSVIACDFSPTGNILATGSTDFTINLWNSSEGTLIKTLTGHEGSINKVAFTPDGERIVSGGSDRSIKIWDVESGELVISFSRQAHSNDINGIDISPDGKNLVSVGSDELVKIWDLETGSNLKTISFFANSLYTIPQPIVDVKYSPDGKFIAIIRTGSQWDRSDNIYIFNPDAERLTYPSMRSYDPFPDYTKLFSICYSTDGNYIMASAENGKVYVWNTNRTTFSRVFEFKTHYLNKLYSTDFNPDGDWIISGGSNGFIYLANCAESKVIDVIEIENGAVYSVQYSPNQTKAASCHANGNVILWDVSMKWTLMN